MHSGFFGESKGLDRRATVLLELILSVHMIVGWRVICVQVHEYNHIMNQYVICIARRVESSISATSMINLSCDIFFFFSDGLRTHQLFDRCSLELLGTANMYRSFRFQLLFRTRYILYVPPKRSSKI